MNESNSIKVIDRQNKFIWTNKILTKGNNRNWKLFSSRDWSNKIMQYKLNKHVTSFDYIDNILIVLSARSGGVSIILLTSIVGVPVKIARASLFFSLTIGTGKKNYWI